MSGNIRQIKTLVDSDKESVIGALEDALEQARAGDVQAVALAFVRPNGALNTLWSDNSNVGPLLGAVAMLQYRLGSALD